MKVEFVSSLDEAAFALAKWDLLGKPNKTAADAVAERAFTQPRRTLCKPIVKLIGVTINDDIATIGQFCDSPLSSNIKISSRTERDGLRCNNGRCGR